MHSVLVSKGATNTPLQLQHAVKSEYMATLMRILSFPPPLQSRLLSFHPPEYGPDTQGKELQSSISQHVKRSANNLSERWLTVTYT